ncbi:hypothetical protein ONS95_014015 [Cadophora gregata]|uniref:uncharacterized protein n=1 Tax=Cadophora gregata TaxID=51156 RepID=UPI0026DB7499|nr:uncharacterized protein ONS95_014015 [Cadophora gregata]KAK0113765.1 hypothetical protein ONS96_014620 [Cadophora gregata f. sp. sojae]KAK0114525.1 hypothetical protein ONS95_014015 [Cadophora gregata]
MQSRLYFSRLGRATLQHTSLSSISVGDQLPTQSVTTRFSRYLNNERETRHSGIEGDGGTSSEHHQGHGLQWTDGNIPEDDPTSSASSQQDLLRFGQRSSSTKYPYRHSCTLQDLHTPAAPSNIGISRLSLWKDQVRPGSVTPSIALGQYLDFEIAAEKQVYWRKVRHVLPANALPTMTLHHLYISSISKDEWEYHDHILRSRNVASLQSRSLGIADVERWAWVLTGDCPESSYSQRSDQIVERLLSLSADHPTFLLLETLRKDVQYVNTLSKLISYTWYYCDKFSWPGDSPKSDTLTSNFSQMHDNEFGVLISRLLYQTRRIWPAATLSVAHMVPRFIQSLSNHRSLDRSGLDQRIFARSCDIVNNVIRRLALPSSIEPLKSMVHNWSAQKVLLNLAGQCDPPLNLDHSSYRAVIQVLTASQKIDRESKAAILRLRSWPPWRAEQDGMDAQRNPDDDLSRALLAAIRAREAGFRETSHDQRMQILGGQELDGTPTIHTRKLVKWRAQAPHERSETLAGSFDVDTAPVRPKLDHPNVWAARVEATRDVREAWRAFVAFAAKEGKPNQALYLAMFQKLNLERARQGRKRVFEAAPGDGKEVLAVPDDNMSEFYKSHSKPPRLDALYNQMLLSGIKPSGQCLVFLVRHARTSTAGINYLRDSGINPLVLRYWTGSKDTSTSPSQRPPTDVIDTVSEGLLCAFLHLICRFAPRAVLATSTEFEKYKLKPLNPKTPVSNGWAIQALERTPYPRLRDPLRQAARLLKNEKVKFRPAWYCLFRALARPNVLLRVSLIGEPGHDALAWRFTVAVLRNFHACGLELDPYGLLLICNVFFKYAEATHDVAPLEHEAELSRGAQLLKDEFAKISRSTALPFCKSILLHSVKWVTLHSYVRCMGIIGDCDEIITVLEWMVEHRDVLEECNSQERNGQIMLSRTLVAARISCYETEYEARAMELVKQVDTWKWPDDGDLQQYTRSLDSDPEDSSDPGEDIDPGRE